MNDTYDTNLTRSEALSVIDYHWTKIEQEARIAVQSGEGGIACSFGRVGRLMERIRLISTKIGVFGFEEEEEEEEDEVGAIQIDGTVWDGDEELERHDRMFNGKEAGDGE